MDHVIPWARGGADDLTNLVPVCHNCNRKKNNKTPAEWWSARWMRMNHWVNGTPHSGGESLSNKNAGLRELYIEAHEQTLVILDAVDEVLSGIAGKKRKSWFKRNTSHTYPTPYMDLAFFWSWNVSRIEEAKTAGWP
jgi:hypothetical protein